MLTDRRNHAYVYWQNVPLDPECSIVNRKTGKTSKSVAKQLVLSMAQKDDDYSEDNPKQDFIGVYAHERMLFLLTHNAIYANILKVHGYLSFKCIILGCRSHFDGRSN